MPNLSLSAKDCLALGGRSIIFVLFMYSLTKSQHAYLALKRTIDIFGSALGIILLSPLLILCWLLTKITSKGPAIFKQPRAGLHAHTFVIFKFRSMRMDAPYVGAEALTPAQQRNLVTPWGRFMRKTSLDEIPQLFNILKGDMSFIGPRPGLTKEGEPELYVARSSFVPSAYDVKPGLGGYAQIMLKRSPDVNDRARLDSYYVQHLSFGFDIKVFVLSFLTLFGFNRGR
jgi:O-antigen biosynthesis protein WbqP